MPDQDTTATPTVSYAPSAALEATGLRDRRASSSGAERQAPQLSSFRSSAKDEGVMMETFEDEGEIDEDPKDLKGFP